MSAVTWSRAGTFALGIGALAIGTIVLYNGLGFAWRGYLVARKAIEVGYLLKSQGKTILDSSRDEFEGAQIAARVFNNNRVYFAPLLWTQSILALASGITWFRGVYLLCTAVELKEAPGLFIAPIIFAISSIAVSELTIYASTTDWANLSSSG